LDKWEMTHCVDAVLTNDVARLRTVTAENKEGR
jgi:hypothetical protein